MLSRKSFSKKLITEFIFLILSMHIPLTDHFQQNKRVKVQKTNSRKKKFCSNKHNLNINIFRLECPNIFLARNFNRTIKYRAFLLLANLRKRTFDRCSVRLAMEDYRFSATNTRVCEKSRIIFLFFSFARSNNSVVSQ